MRLIARGSISAWSGIARPLRKRLQYPTSKWLFLCFMAKIRSLCRPRSHFETPLRCWLRGRAEAVPAAGTFVGSGPGTLPNAAEERQIAGFEQRREHEA